MEAMEVVRESTISVLVQSWKWAVKDGYLLEVEMIESLHEQLQDTIQGRDLCELELQDNPDLALLLGYDVDTMTDEQWDEWVGIAREAARRYLKEVGA